MAAPGRRDRPALIEQILLEPQRFELFQALRLLHVFARQHAEGTRGSVPEIGRDTPPDREPVRLRSHVSLRFPASEISSAAPPPADRASGAPDLVATPLGLLGGTGALPTHYTELALRRLRLNDPSLREFLGIWDHRILSLFYRAWTKHRLAVSAERDPSGAPGGDEISAVLFSVAGFGAKSLRNRLTVNDAVFVRFGAAFAQLRRPVVVLESMLADYFQLPVSVEQFRFDVLTLDVRDRTRLGAATSVLGNHQVLGGDAVLGRHALDASGRFRIRVGPVDYATYRRFLPDGDLLRPFSDLARTYAGPSPAFSVRPLLLPDEAPPLRLSDEGPAAPLLGWNTWLRSQPIRRVFDGADFEMDPRVDALLEPLRRLRARSGPGGAVEGLLDGLLEPEVPDQPSR